MRLTFICISSTGCEHRHHSQLGVHMRGAMSATLKTFLVTTTVFTGSAWAQDEAVPENETQTLDEIIIQATRTTLPPSALPNTIEVIDTEDLARQAQVTGSAVEVVSALIPSFSPTREKLTGSGETLRGRSPLYLIDGVPQSNPLRNGSRDGYTIDPFFIDRVEIIFGSNAIQGIGATGGVVNYVTAAPPAEGAGWTGRVLTQFSTADEFGDSMSYRLAGRAGRDFGIFDATFGIAFHSRGAYYSGDGRRIGVDGVQGEVQDSESLSFFGKAGIDLGSSRRIEVMAQHFNLDGDGDYVRVAGSRADGIPSTSIRGTSPGVFPTNEVTTISLTYTDDQLFGGVLNSQLYYQDFEAVFGGGTFATFQDPAIAPVGTLFDQSANNSTKMGFRFSYERVVDFVPGLRVIAGFDGVNDETFQELAATGRNWVPKTDFTSLAPFVQLHQSFFSDRVHLSGGVRQEFSTFKVDDYETLASYGPQQVSGGEPDFSETLINFGGTAEIVDGITVYASYAEGFTMPDIGRILRAINQPGQDVDTLIDVEPVVSDNIEVGVEWSRGPVSASAAYFWSNSDNGSRLVLVGDVFEVSRQRTEISGLELNGIWQTPVEGLTLSGGLALLEGRTDLDGDGNVDSDLDGANISPDRLNFSAQYVTGPLDFKVQTRSFLRRNFDGIGLDESFDGHTLVDGFVRYETPIGDFSFAASNLFDKQYVTYDSQTVRTASNTRFFAGRGRVLSIGFNRSF